MLKLSDINTIFFDVDETLVLSTNTVLPEILDTGISIPIHNYVFFKVPHKPHIELLKELKASGNQIVVWSQGGSDWCEAVVDALNLRDYVDLCINKPYKFVDDLQASGFMPNSIKIYKNYYGK